jgi:hypothetical protein
VAHGIRRKVEEHCYVVGMHDQEEQGLSLLAGSRYNQIFSLVWIVKLIFAQTFFIRSCTSTCTKQNYGSQLIAKAQCLS